MKRATAGRPFVRPEKRISHQVEDPLTETDVAEDHPEGDQRERDGKPDTNGEKENPRSDRIFPGSLLPPASSRVHGFTSKGDAPRQDSLGLGDFGRARDDALVLSVRSSFTDLRISKSPGAGSGIALRG